GPARVFLEIRNRLAVGLDRFPQPVEFAEITRALPLDDGTLSRIVAVDELRGKRVDAALHGVEIGLIAVELSLQLGHALAPVLGVLRLRRGARFARLRVLLVLVRRRLRGLCRRLGRGRGGRRRGRGDGLQVLVSVDLRRPLHGLATLCFLLRDVGKRLCARGTRSSGKQKDAGHSRQRSNAHGSPPNISDRGAYGLVRHVSRRTAGSGAPPPSRTRATVASTIAWADRGPKASPRMATTPVPGLEASTPSREGSPSVSAGSSPTIATT